MAAARRSRDPAISSPRWASCSAAAASNALGLLLGLDRGGHLGLGRRARLLDPVDFLGQPLRLVFQIVALAHLLLLAFERLGKPRLGLGLAALPVAALTPRGAVPLAVGSHLAGAGRSSRALVRHRRCGDGSLVPRRAKLLLERGGVRQARKAALGGRDRVARSFQHRGEVSRPARSGRRAEPPAARSPQRRYPLHAPPRGSRVRSRTRPRAPRPPSRGSGRLRRSLAPGHPLCR